MPITKILIETASGDVLQFSNAEGVSGDKLKAAQTLIKGEIDAAKPEIETK